MKTIRINSVLALFFLVFSFACQSPGNRTGTEREGMDEPEAEERLEEPQVRDGMPEASLRDSLATDTAEVDTLP